MISVATVLSCIHNIKQFAHRLWFDIPGPGCLGNPLVHVPYFSSVEQRFSAQVGSRLYCVAQSWGWINSVGDHFPLSSPQVVTFHGHSMVSGRHIAPSVLLQLNMKLKCNLLYFCQLYVPVDWHTFNIWASQEVDSVYPHFIDVL